MWLQTWYELENQRHKINSAKKLHILTEDKHLGIQHINHIFVEEYRTEAEKIPHNKRKQRLDTEKRKSIHRLLRLSRMYNCRIRRHLARRQRTITLIRVCLYLLATAFYSHCFSRIGTGTVWHHRQRCMTSLSLKQHRITVFLQKKQHSTCEIQHYSMISDYPETGLSHQLCYKINRNGQKKK